MKFNKLIALGIALMALVSCSQDNETVSGLSPENTNAKLVVALPGTKTGPATYSLATGEQNSKEMEIAKMALYLFDSTDKLVYKETSQNFGPQIAYFDLVGADPSIAGQSLTAVFIANQDLLAGAIENTTTYTEFKAMATTVITNNLAAPFVMYGQSTGDLLPSLALPNRTTVSMERLAARIDITNKVGGNVVIASAKIVNAATSADLVPNGTATIAHADFGAVTNNGYNVTDGSHTGGDINKMWSQLYAYPNTNATTPTQVAITYSWNGNTTTKTVDFKDANGTVLAIDRNHRYEITITDGAINVPDFTVTVTDWVNGGDLDEANAAEMLRAITAPATAGNISVVGTTITITNGAGASLGFDYATSTTMNAQVIEGADWLSVSDAPVTAFTYATKATGGFRGTVTASSESNPTFDDRTAKIKLGNAHSGYATYTIIQKGATPPAVNVAASNSYILTAGQDITFSVARANADGVTRIGANDKLVAKFIWTDNANGLADNSVVKSVSLFGKGTTAVLEIAAGTGKGNAVVAVYNATTGAIAWSWHIWATDYNPATTNKIYTSTGTASATAPDAGKTNVFMDRNLGALSATPGDAGAQGLLYQWGRKDPFIGKGRWENNTNETLVYNDRGAAIGISKLKSTETPNAGVPNNLEYTIQNPMAFISSVANTNISYEWYTADDNRSSQKDDLWGYNGTTTINKSVYDPCPIGWRMPQYGAWNGLVMTAANIREFKWADADYGRIGTGASADIGYYPAAGSRIYNSGNFSSVSVNGSYWTANNNGGAGTVMLINPTSLAVNNYAGRASGCSVRCVKE